jgi:hypothetical protein
MPLGLQFLDTPQRFLPLHPATLRDRMLRDPRLSDGERQQLTLLFEMIAARFHFEFRRKLEQLKTLYDRFDADRDTLPLAPAGVDITIQREELSRAFAQLLLDGNYVELSREQVVTCAEYQSQVGLVVQANLSDFAELRVFYRGLRHEERVFRPWMTPWRHQREMVHVLLRVAAFIRLVKQPDGPIILKLFKNVVAEDLETLLPDVRIRMRLLDHVKISSSVAGGIATAAWKAFTAAILSWWVALLVIAGFFAAAVRGMFSFVSSKTRYMQTLASNLYFRSLANNSSVLTYLIDAAEEEECKELLLAYFLLYVERDRDFTQQTLDRRVEQWLKTEFDLEVNFEIADAVQKLHDKQLLFRSPPPHPAAPPGEYLLKVCDLPAALRRLDGVWNGYFSVPK